MINFILEVVVIDRFHCTSFGGEGGYNDNGVEVVAAWSGKEQWYDKDFLITVNQIDGLMRRKRNFTSLAMELHVAIM